MTCQHAQGRLSRCRLRPHFRQLPPLLRLICCLVPVFIATFRPGVLSPNIVVPEWIEIYASALHKGGDLGDKANP